jgi:FMN phosphatase YigB (HAD superfamily)
MKATFIDWHNTLSTGRFWAHRSDSRLSATDLQEVERFVFGSPSLTRVWMTGVLGAEQVCRIAAKNLGLPSDDILADLKTSCEAMELYDPLVVEPIRALGERGVKTVIATDNMDAFTRWTVPVLNLDAIFEQVLNSADVGMRKRNPPFFRNWLEQHEVEPNEAFLLDDRVGPYRRSGMALWPVVHPSLLAHVLGEVSKFVET